MELMPRSFARHPRLHRVCHECPGDVATGQSRTALAQGWALDGGLGAQPVPFLELRAAMALTSIAKKLLLDFLTGAAAAPQPLGFYAHIADDLPRQSAIFAPASGGSAVLAAALTFASCPSERTVQGLGLWDSASAGNCLWSGAFETLLWLRSGRELRIAAEWIVIGWAQ